MRVPLEWLKQIVDVSESAEDVATRLTMGGLEVEGIEESATGPVLDVYVTPNRGDCLSMLGVGREIAALYNRPLKLPMPPASQLGGQAAQQTSMTIEEAALCPRYAARIVRNIKIEPSPAWMQARLDAAGQRPINNIVDVTNYVMLELGQPLHAFDLNKLAEKRIVVRRARSGESIRTLDGEQRELDQSMLVIADAEKPVAVAGVMGGADSEVDENTTDLLLESAHFDPLSVRRTSRGLKLRTEASYRFERVVDPEGVNRAVDRACQLLTEMGQTGVVEGVVDVYPAPKPIRHAPLRPSRAAALLGMDIDTDVANDCLTRLGFRIESQADGDTLQVQIPSFRPDITQEEDLIEEIGRIYGYENIPETLPQGATTQGGDSDEGRLVTDIKQLFVGAGLQEVITHSLTAPAFFDSPDDAARRVPIRNALSADISGLRRSLIPSLLDVAKHNQAFQQNVLALFEVGRVWQMQTGEDHIPMPTEYVAIGGLVVGALETADWRTHGKGEPADFGTIRGLVERLAHGLNLPGLTFASIGDRAATVPLLHPGRGAFVQLAEGQILGMVGELHPRIAAELSFRDRIYVFELSLEAIEAAFAEQKAEFHELPRFPAVTRDLAPHLAENVPYGDVEAAVRSITLPLLEGFRLTDVFRGGPIPEGQKSLTLSFTFRNPARTLQEAEISEAIGQLRNALEAECGATFAG